MHSSSARPSHLQRSSNRFSWLVVSGLVWFLGMNLGTGLGTNGSKLRRSRGQLPRHPQPRKTIVLNLGMTHRSLWTTFLGLTRINRGSSTIHRTYHHNYSSNAQSVSS